MEYNDFSKFIENTAFDIQRVETYGFTIIIYCNTGCLKEFSFKVSSVFEGTLLLTSLIEKYDLKRNPNCEHQYFPRNV